MKRYNSQSNKNKNKIITDFSDYFFNKKPIIKNSSYYTKLYSPKQAAINEKRSSINYILPTRARTILSANRNSITLKRVFKNINSSRNVKIKWPKVTHPKWPFSKREVEPKEKKQLRLLSSKPSNKYHNFNTIKWLGQKYSDSVKEKSIYSLLPNNGKPIIPEDESEFDKRHRQMIEYLESFKGPGGREKYVNINPKYFYDNTTFKKILKLKEMFLEFDKKGNHKMVIKEIVDLFKQNNINIDINEIKELFFKNVKIKNKKDEAKNLLYLDFYQFMDFALKREQDFRQFMRVVKKRNKIEENSKNLKTFNYNDEKKDNVYIPMNFDLIFDYLINKEKQRNSIEVVENAIKEMDKIIQKGNEDDDIQTIEASPDKKKKSKISNISKQIKTSKTLKNTNNLKSTFLKKFLKTKTIMEVNSPVRKSINKNIKINSKSANRLDTKTKYILNKESMEKINSINFAQLIKEFYSLFGLEDNKNGDNDLCKDKINNMYNQMKDKDNEEKIYTEEMKKEIRINCLKELNNNNFEKYHDLKLALNATKEQIKNLKNTNYLVEDEKQIYNMVDIRDIINRDGNNTNQCPRFNNQKKVNNLFRSTKFEDNFDYPSIYRNNNYNSFKTDYNKTLNVEKNYNNKRKKFKIRKPLYNFYWGKPQIMNFDDDEINNQKTKQKYDYVPNEFLTITKNNRK